MRKLLLISLACLMISMLSSCTTVQLHPVTDQDIKMQDGWVCMSQDYVKHVMKVKLEKK